MIRTEKISRFKNFKEVNKKDPFFLVLSPLIESLITAINQYAKGKVLDIGCGNKPYRDLLSHCESYIGCDIVQSSEEVVDIVCDATSIPINNDSIDTVISTQTIEHIGDYKVMLREANRLLKLHGHIIISGPMYWPIHEEPHDYYRFTKFGFKFILEEAGFEIIQIIPNGGKWALFGQVVINTFPYRLVNSSFFRRIVNNLFHWLDKKYFDDTNTMNYVAVAKKVKYEN